MKRAIKLAAIATLVATLAATSAFADWRTPRETNRHYDRDRVITVEGRIRDIDRDRNGFVIRIDRGNYVLFARVNADVRGQSQHGRSTRVRDLERGDRIRATGTVQSGRTMYVDTIRLLREEDDRWDRDDRTLYGIVQSVDRSRGLVQIREERSGRTITVDTRRADRDERDLRRGDRVAVSGDWQRNGSFEAERIDIDRRGGGRW